MTKTKMGSGSKNSVSAITSEAIKSHTERFLEKGGQINFINVGISGVNHDKVGKHITLKSKKEKVES